MTMDGSIDTTKRRKGDDRPGITHVAKLAEVETTRRTKSGSECPRIATCSLGSSGTRPQTGTGRQQEKSRRAMTTRLKEEGRRGTRARENVGKTDEEKRERRGGGRKGGSVCGEEIESR